MIKNYNKLVRDNIPEIARIEGNIADWIEMDEQQYTIQLLNKIVEEAKEVKTAKNRTETIHELADLYEVIEAIKNLFKIDEDEIREIKLAKKKVKGGFNNKIFLYSIDDQKPVDYSWLDKILQSVKEFDDALEECRKGEINENN